MFDRLGPSLVGAMIYLVEDDEDVRESLRVLLEISGYSVEEFESGADLLTHGDISQAACIIMDVNLPGESGLQILARLRRQSVTTPVFVVTGRPTNFAREESKRLNAAGFFEKPVPGHVLLEALGAILV